MHLFIYYQISKHIHLTCQEYRQIDEIMNECCIHIMYVNMVLYWPPGLLSKTNLISDLSFLPLKLNFNAVYVRHLMTRLKVVFQVTFIQLSSECLHLFFQRLTTQRLKIT